MQINLQNPDNLGAQSTDSGTVPNLEWSFSDSQTKIFNGGWTRTQVVIDLPASHDSATLGKGSGVFPENSGHYIENTSATEELVWIEIEHAEDPTERGRPAEGEAAVDQGVGDPRSSK
ncbi:hypothetical protein LZ554_005451 [Drepanopeziza brunnea f. sp. 'monogermtubi']|nr:hypothetical protein LZ554_005451 [Drepanopeziza brunnea f. sp. 'monogermtubi']